MIHLSFDLTATQQKILDENPSRIYAIFVNDSDTVAYLSLGEEAAANKGIRINAAGGSYEINLTNPFTGRIYAISLGAAKRLNVMESSRVK